MIEDEERSIHPLPDSDESRLHDEALVRHLRRIINFAVRVLAVLMTVVIVWGVVDVAYGIYDKATTKPYFLLEINEILATFGAFIAVLIAIEIFINITIYLRDDVIHVKIVLATALMAIARKIIVLDTDKLDPEYLYGLAAILFAMCLGYWLIIIKPNGTGQGPV